MKPSRRLGRGLDALVPLAPADADGTARVADALRGGPAGAVLALSGHSVEDFFRAPAAAAPPVTPSVGPPVAPPVAPTVRAPSPRPDADAHADADAPPPSADAGVQYELFDPKVDLDAEPAATDPPAPVAPVSASRELPPSPQPTVSPTALTSPTPPAAPAVFDDGAAFLDEQVGGIVLPDVELE